jgi:hypothetical protein
VTQKQQKVKKDEERTMQEQRKTDPALVATRATRALIMALTMPSARMDAKP